VQCHSLIANDHHTLAFSPALVLIFGRDPFLLG